MSVNPVNALGKNYIPENEAERIAVLRQYDVLFGPSEAVLNNIAHIVAEDLDMPFAMVSLVDTEEVIFKGNYGLKGLNSTPRGMSLCSLVILNSEPTVITNAAEDPCLLANPMVHGAFGLRFYAGAPIITPEGYALGAICVFDKKERRLTPKQQARLARYAAIVMHEMVLRRAFVEERKAHEAETAIRQRLITREVVKAQEKERAEIGLELHDNVSQMLTTIKLYNEMARDGVGQTQDILERSSQYLQTCINEIRTLSQRLSLPTLGKISFADSVQELVASFVQRGKLDICLSVEEIADLELTRELHVGLFRIVQQSLSNIARHSGASLAEIVITLKDGAIRIKVTDNGKLPENQTGAAGAGMDDIRMRVESLNGTFSLNSRPGAGNCLTCRIPLVQEDAG